MNLTPEQKTTIQADIIAKQANGQPLDGITSEQAIANYYNTYGATLGWRTEVPASKVRNSISLSSYTPNDAPAESLIDNNRALRAQIKQTNLLMMLQGASTFDASLPQVRLDLRDSVIQIPTGAGGAMVASGGASGVTTLTTCTRVINVVEKLLAAAVQGSDTTGSVTARVLTSEGTLSVQQVSDIVAGL